MTTVIKRIPYKLDINQLKKSLMINNQPDEETLIQMVTELDMIANLKAIYREGYITEKSEDYIVIDNQKLSSRILRKNITDANRVFIYIITVGREIQDWADGKNNILESFWADEIQKMLLDSAVDFIYAKLDQLIGSEIVSEMNPGSLRDWPIQEQSKIFSLLGDVENEIGVKLTDSFLMLPAKTVSGIRFSTKSEFKNCQLCQRDNCPGRRTPFDQELMDRINSI
ncbi:MAG: vitamin B12 dependent-methionine synthase activation domain-containing protein [Halanaerobiales bacterium]